MYSITLSLIEEWDRGAQWGCQDDWDLYEQLKGYVEYLEDILADGIDGECITDEGYEDVKSAINKCAALSQQCEGVGFSSSGTSNGNTPQPPTPDDCCLFNGQRPITSLPQLGDNFNTTTVLEFLEEAYFTATPPQATLGGGGTREFGSSNAVTLAWAAIKGSLPITGITVNAVAITPTGNSQSGSESATATQDVSTTFNMAVTDGTTIATASTTVLWDLYNWYGTSAAAPTNSAEVRALSNTFNNTFTLVTGSTNLYFSIWLKTGRTLVSVIDLGNLKLDITADFVASSLSVNDAAGTPKTGNLYLKTNGVPFSPSTNLLITVA